jgi:hypothetical protein
MPELGWMKDLGVAGLIFVPFFFLLRWLLQEVKLILERESIERKDWQVIIRGFQDCLNSHTAQAQAFHESVAEAHRFQREEHKEMIATLGRINGYTHIGKTGEQGIQGIPGKDK